MRWPRDACRSLPPHKQEELALNTRAKPKAKSESNPTVLGIISTDEVFEDGAMIELVAGSSENNKPDLMLWNGSKATVGPRVEHRGRIYEASELTPTLYRATRFPSPTSGLASASKPS